MLWRLAQARFGHGSRRYVLSQIFAPAIAHLGGDTTALHRIHEVLVHLGCLIERVLVLLQVVSELFLAVVRRIMRLHSDHVVGILSSKLLDSLLMEQGVVLVDAVDAGEVTDVKEVHRGARQTVIWIIIIENGALFLVPIWLGRQHADVINPVGRRLEPYDLDILVAQLVCQGFVVGDHVWRRRDVAEDVRVYPRHVRQSVLLHLILVVVRGEDIVQAELALDALTLEVGREFDRYTVGERVPVVQLYAALDAEGLRLR